MKTEDEITVAHDSHSLFNGTCDAALSGMGILMRKLEEHTGERIQAGLIVLVNEAGQVMSASNLDTENQLSLLEFIIESNKSGELDERAVGGTTH